MCIIDTPPQGDTECKKILSTQNGNTLFQGYTTRAFLIL